jgi:hypothetical protein
MCDNGMVWATDTEHLIHYRAGVNDNNIAGDNWQMHTSQVHDGQDWQTTNGKLR